MLTAKYEPKVIDEATGEPLYKVTLYRYDKNKNPIEEIRSGEYVRLNERAASFNTIRYTYDTVNSVFPDASYVIDGERYNTNYVSNSNKHSELERELNNFLHMMEAEGDAHNSLVF